VFAGDPTQELDLVKLARKKHQLRHIRGDLGRGTGREHLAEQQRQACGLFGVLFAVVVEVAEDGGGRGLDSFERSARLVQLGVSVGPAGFYVSW